MKLLIIGATGMTGHALSIYFKEACHNVTVFNRRKFEYCNNIVGDITDIDTVKRVITDGKYDAVINAAGVLSQSAENNKSTALLLNSFLPHYLSDLTKDTNTRVIQISTDCVYSGKTGGYGETSLKDGETFYDRSKAIGELENNKDLTFRNSIIGPDINSNGIGLFNWFMQQKGQIPGYTQAKWTGVTTITLARAIEKALEVQLTGLYHLVNNHSISKFELLTLLGKHFNKNNIQIVPSEAIQVDKSLINNRTDFTFLVPSYQEMILEMKEWIDNHKYLYSHYSI